MTNTQQMNDRTYIKLLRNIVKKYDVLMDFTRSEVKQFDKVFPQWETNDEFSEFKGNIQKRWQQGR